jgi:hypothetical protein
MNYATSPTNSARGKANGAPTILRVMNIRAALIAASSNREYSYPPTFRMAVSHAKSTRFCRRGGTRDRSARRTLGPYAVR